MLTTEYEKGLKILNMVKERLELCKDKLIKAVNKDVKRKKNENTLSYEIRRIGGFKYHLMSIDLKRKNSSYEYHSIREVFPFIYNSFMFPEDFSVNKLQCGLTEPVQYGFTTVDSRNGNCYYLCFITNFLDANINEIHEQEMIQCNINVHDDDEDLVKNDLFIESNVPIDLQLTNSQEFQNEEQPLQIDPLIHEELNKVVLEEHSIEFNQTHLAEAQTMVMGAIKSIETKVRLCEETCYIPEKDWPFKIRKAIESLKDMDLDQVIVAILSMSNCNKECCIKNLGYDKSCTNMIKFYNLLEPCYSNLRSILRRYREMKMCCLWIKNWREIVATKNSEALKKAVENPVVPKDIKCRISTSIDSSLDQQSEDDILIKYGHIIDAVHCDFNDNEIHACLICGRLHYKKEVNLFFIFLLIFR